VNVIANPELALPHVKLLLLVAVAGAHVTVIVWLVIHHLPPANVAELRVVAVTRIRA